MNNSAAVRDDAKLVTAVFDSGDAVERAYDLVSRRGYGIPDINVVMSDETRHRYFAQDHPINMALGLKVTEGGEMGGPMGATLGTIIPAIIGVGAIALPGLGFILAGPAAVALAAAGATGLTVGLIAALSDWGIPEERAKQYEAAIHDGGILMGVKPRTDEDAAYFADQWQALGGRLVSLPHERAASPAVS
jgi:hypothetical protein